ncbi:MAG: hypothetical protein ACD_58C00297G0004 [uncultured bacterium]|nr:MAG: hypothetical protein ACD_58C00297G0004 [uncultured bacterium]
MTARLYYLSKDILRIINEYTHEEINHQDFLDWIKKHPCLTNNYCTKQEIKMLDTLNQMINQKNINKCDLTRFYQKIQQKYLKEKYGEST